MAAPLDLRAFTAAQIARALANGGSDRVVASSKFNPNGHSSGVDYLVTFEGDPATYDVIVGFHPNSMQFVAHVYPRRK